MFFFEGPKVLFKVALAILSLSFSSPKSQKEVAGFFELTRKLRALPIEVTHEDTLIQEVRGDDFMEHYFYCKSFLTPPISLNHGAWSSWTYKVSGQNSVKPTNVLIG